MPLRRRCFDLARSLSVHVQTTAKTREKIVSAHKSDLLELGDEVTFEATHLGIRQQLTSRIVEFDRPNRFVDQMVYAAPSDPCGTNTCSRRLTKKPQRWSASSLLNLLSGPLVASLTS